MNNIVCVGFGAFKTHLLLFTYLIDKRKLHEKLTTRISYWLHLYFYFSFFCQVKHSRIVSPSNGYFSVVRIWISIFQHIVLISLKTNTIYYCMHCWCHEVDVTVHYEFFSLKKAYHFPAQGGFAILLFMLHSYYICVERYTTTSNSIRFYIFRSGKFSPVYNQTI